MSPAGFSYDDEQCPERGPMLTHTTNGTPECAECGITTYNRKRRGTPANPTNVQPIRPAVTKVVDDEWDEQPADCINPDCQGCFQRALRQVEGGETLSFQGIDTAIEYCRQNEVVGGAVGDRFRAMRDYFESLRVKLRLASIGL